MAYIEIFDCLYYCGVIWNYPLLKPSQRWINSTQCSSCLYEYQPFGGKLFTGTWFKAQSDIMQDFKQSFEMLFVSFLSVNRAIQLSHTPWPY